MDEDAWSARGHAHPTLVFDLGPEYLQDSPDLHCIVATSDWSFMWTGGAWHPLLGWPASWLLHIPLRDLLHPEESDSLLGGLARAERDRDEYLARFRHAEGGYRWLAWNGRVSRDGQRLIAGARDVSDRVETEQAQRRQLNQAQFAATHDSLTGLANRELLTEHLALTIARSMRTGVPPLVVFIDLNGFKRVNDERGHAFGDAALRAFGGRLESTFRPSDLVARVGGDEFIVILEDGDPAAVKQRLANAMHRPLQLNEGDCPLSAAVGVVAVADPETSPAQAIAAADREMYRAKVVTTRPPAQHYGVAPDRGQRS